MFQASAEFASFCRILELERARALLGAEGDLDPAALREKLLQRLLLSALQETDRSFTNYHGWLETISAINDPATPRSIPRTEQLLATEVELRQQQLPQPTSDLLAQLTRASELRSLPSLQRLEVPPARLSAEVQALVSQPQATVERALLANWLEWRALPPLRRSEFQEGAEVAALLEPLTPRERKKKARLVAGKLGPGLRREFEQASLATLPAARQYRPYQFKQPKGQRTALVTKLLGAFVLVLGTLNSLFLRENARRDLAFNQPYTAMDERGPRPVFPPSDSNALRGSAERTSEQFLFASLDQPTQQQVILLTQIKLWLLQPPHAVDYAEAQLFPGPESREAIRAKRLAATNSEAPAPLDKASTVARALTLLKETRPLWEAELAGRTPDYSGPILKAFAELDSPAVFAWIQADAEAERRIDDLVFSNSSQRQSVARYRAAERRTLDAELEARSREMSDRFRRIPQRAGAGLPQPSVDFLLRTLGEEIEPNAQIRQQAEFREFLAQRDTLEILQPYAKDSMIRQAGQKIPPLPFPVRELLKQRWQTWQKNRSHSGEQQPSGLPPVTPSDHK